MRAVIGRVSALLAVLLVAGYLLQAQDSAPPSARAPAVPRAAVSRVVVVQADAGGREWFTARDRIIPYGFTALTFPILMYHYIRTPPSPRLDPLGYKLSVSPADFEAQMNFLQAAGYHPVDFDDVRAYFAHERPLPSKPVVITLDDGYRDLYTTAFPILKEHGFKAVAYIVTGFVNEKRYVTTEQVQEMDRSGLIEIGAHTVDHVNLTHASWPEATYELVQSKRWLEQLLGHSVLDMAYPSGKFDVAVVAAVEEAGYDTAVVEDGSTYHSIADRYVWTRTRVVGGDKLSVFEGNLGPSMPSVITTVIEVEPGFDSVSNPSG